MGTKNDDKSRHDLPANVTGSREAHPKRWHVVLVRIYHEKKISQQLTKMGVENYLPIQTRIHQWSDRRKKIDHIVIPMVVFVHVTPQERNQILTLSSVIRYMVLHGESTPAVIPDEQMERFKFMLDYSEEAVCMNDTPLSPGEKVRVIKGSLVGLEGELVTINGKTKVVIRLDALGCASVDMPMGFVERMSVNDSNFR